MPQDRQETFTQLEALLTENTTVTLPLDGSKYVVMSDLHMGDGGKADDFRINEKTVVAALNHYQAHGYTVLLLGDIEELWQFDLDQITDRYDATVYRAMRAFGDRLYRVYGNHDKEWSLPKDPARHGARRKRGAPEAIKLTDAAGTTKVFLVHGHQGSIESDKNSWFSRFVVRGLFKPIEPVARFIGAYGHAAATKSQVATDYERIFYAWAKAAKTLVMCGHSHRAIFASRSYAQLLQEEIRELQAENLVHRDNPDKIKANIRKIQKLNDKYRRERQRGRDIDPSGTSDPLPCYFNTGCALYEDGATMMEIEGGEIRLVKWDRTELAREVYQHNDLDEFIQQVEQD